ncbi:MAG: type II toxin-antitoxin system VapC family toxin [Ilumatobacteraceae bacterium]
MRYWDASALVPLLVNEATSPDVRAWVDDDPVVATWAWTVVEITSAVERRFGDGTIDHDERRDVLARLTLLAEQWDEMHARRLLARYPLRAADAAQLGAALVLFEDRPVGHGFVCLDQRLTHAAEMEGFSALSTR